MEAGPYLLHTAMQTALLRRRVLQDEGATGEIDQMEAAVRDLFVRAGVNEDAVSSKAFRVGLVAFLHALVVRAAAMSISGAVPDDAPETVAAVSAEMAAVMIGAMKWSDVMEALVIATTEGDDIDDFLG